MVHSGFGVGLGEGIGVILGVGLDPIVGVAVVVTCGVGLGGTTVGEGLATGCS